MVNGLGAPCFIVIGEGGHEDVWVLAESSSLMIWLCKVAANIQPLTLL